MKILQILAESNKPLSSREIEKGVVSESEQRDRQVYRILENELCVQKFNHKFFLFEWNELLSSIDGKPGVRKEINLSRIVENLNTIGLKLNKSVVEFNKNEDEDGVSVEIRNGSNDSRLIKIQREAEHFVTIKIFKNGKRIRIPTSLTIKEVNNKLHVFYHGITGKPTERGIVYLKMSLNDSAQKKVEAIKSINPDLFNCSYEVKKIITKPELDDTLILSDVSEIESDRKNLEYRLNTRGLILYTLGIINEENEKGRARNVEISKILENLAENYREDFPFLIHYKDVKELYDKLATDEGASEYEYFQVKLIKQIALELQHNIDLISKQELDYYITKRYSDDLTKRFVDSILPGSLFGGLVGIIPPIIRRYYVHNLVCLREYLRDELEKTEYDINDFNLKTHNTLSIS